MAFLIVYVQVVMMLMSYFQMGPTEALKYYVGGKEGWSLKPSNTFNHWASQNRFQVNDSLIFEYKNGTDSVLQVEPADYETCNKTKPIHKLENSGDHSTFNFNYSGLFFFISGHSDNCKKGQKIIILVMAPRNYTHKSSSPAPSPVTGITPTPAPAPFKSITHIPRLTPSPTPAPSPLPAVSSPVVSPAPSQAVLPFGPSSGPAPAPASGDEQKSGVSSVSGDHALIIVMMFWIVFM